MDRKVAADASIGKGRRLYDVDWLSFRVLVEVLLGTGARISEALSLKRTSINFQTGEATIIGKGNKVGIPVKVNADSGGKPNGLRELKVNSSRSEATLAC